MTTTFAVQPGRTLNAPPATTSEPASVRAAEWLSQIAVDVYDRAERRLGMPGEWVAARELLDRRSDA